MRDALLKTMEHIPADRRSMIERERLVDMCIQIAYQLPGFKRQLKKLIRESRKR